MVAAIKKSGYFMEQRIFPVLEKSEFFVTTNPVYADPITKKTREYDFSGTWGKKVYREDFNFLFIHVLGECLNNTQPIVFFEHDPFIEFLFHENVRCSGIPMYFQNSKREDISLQDFFYLDKFHHYCNGIYATQYCTFKKKSSKDKDWMAWHDDEHHGIFDSLVNATIYEVESSFSDWEPPPKNEEEDLDLNFYYPLLILGGDFFICRQKKGSVNLIEKNHIQFRKQLVIGDTNEIFHIDVVTERYLRRYLRNLIKEHEKLIQKLKRKKAEVRKAIEYIVTEARKLEKNYSEALKF